MQLDTFFKPSSIAVIGASRNKKKIGRIIFDQLTRKFKKVFPVNPNAIKIGSHRSFKSLSEIKEKVDLVVIAIPAQSVPYALKDCVKKGVKSVIIISSGFSETGTGEGKRLENELRNIIKGSNTRFIGPNVMGLYDAYTGLDTIFIPQNRMKRPKRGGITFISQSGAVGISILDWLAERNVGISKFVSYGNAADVNECDLLEYLIEDKTTKVVTLYIEGIKGEGKRFVRIAKKLTKKKPVIVLKSGKTKKGIKAVASHTGSLAGSARIYSGVLKQTGMIEAKDWIELFDFAKAFAMQPLPKENKLLIVTNGGGFGVLATDEVMRCGLNLKDLPAEIKRKLEKIMPRHVILHNPIDLAGDADVKRYEIAIDSCLPFYDGAIIITLFELPTIDEKIVDVLVKVNKKYRKPLLVCAVGGSYTRNFVKKLEENGIPVYSSPERAVKAFTAMSTYSKRLTS